MGEGSLEVRDEGPEADQAENAGPANDEHSANNNHNDEANKEAGAKQINLRAQSSRPLDSRIDSSLDNYQPGDNNNRPHDGKEKV
jgi:hypothetical protein